MTRAGGAGPLRRWAVIAGALAVFATLCALGVWQVQRLAWKTDLIARVETRLAAPPIPAPGPAEWAGLDPRDAEYRRVEVTGSFRTNNDTLVKAVTERGPGFWVMTPMQTPQGWLVLVNRGFVADTARDDRPLPDGKVTVTGLMRISQPGGAFLRANDPEAGRWYSRDTAAIAATQGIGPVAPYFIDADAGGTDAQPVGGLTVIRFRNSHLGYALTWFSLAALWAGWIIWARRRVPHG
ncbi:SURF1 family protein (plasmid) [Paracoccus methylovorus]|uniref:SURF1-like protein n=1 Tax=Paracoccus methylovorus TaxID=2812658 RepID=A0ABX7JKJ6_9RHOB|nr:MULTISPECIES: SURF1 family protein [Paracoccus]QRZ14495.1 SURF1 family protein [Paracoccus methylovorus]